MIGSPATLHEPQLQSSQVRGLQPVRAALRDRTAGIHEALHGAAPFAAISEGRLELDGYRRLLRALFDYHSSLAAAVETGCRYLHLPALLAACEGRRKLLAADLDSLGGTTRDLTGRPFAAVEQAWAAGALYTLVGSTLGGKVIYRQLDYLLPTSSGRSFFAGTRSDGARWRELCGRLEIFGTEHESLTGLVHGAHAAFEYFASCLERHS